MLRSRFITKLQDKGKIKHVQAETRITLQQIPVPLETDKPVHDKQMAAICLPWHNPEERKREVPSCELDKIKKQDSNAGQPQMMSWDGNVSNSNSIQNRNNFIPANYMIITSL